MRLRISGILSVLVLLVLSAVVMVGSISAQGDDDDDDDGGGSNCPVGQGYWRNTATWPVVELTISGQVYTQAELLIILNMPPQGDASLILAHQLIAAKLNMLGGRDAIAAAGLIAQAETLLAPYAGAGKLPYNLPPSSVEGGTITNIANVLDAYNAGLLSANCGLTPTATLTPTQTPEGTLTSTVTVTPQGTATVASTPALTPSGTLQVTVTPQGTPAPTNTPSITVTPGGPPIIIIEGPVTAINVNIITIYNINVQLQDDDPNLAVIRVGDIVRIEGDRDTRDGVIIIVAITVVIINVDVNIDTGEVWRDEGNCANPPPPWAPANGWRRRCGGNGGFNNLGGNNGGGNNGNGNGRGDDDDDDD